MLGAFRDFLSELEAKYPYSYEAGEFSPLVDMFEELTNETSGDGIRISDMAVELVRSSEEPLIRRICFMESLAVDLQTMGSPEAVCARCLRP